MTASRLSAAPPLRFLALVAVGWICLRAAVLLPEAWSGPSATVPTAARPATELHRPPRKETATAHAPSAGQSTSDADSRIREPPYKGKRPPHLAQPALLQFASGSGSGSASAVPHPSSGRLPLAIVGPASSDSPQHFQLHAAARDAGRWSVAAWALLRQERGTSSLAPGGTLGGSQAGARLLYRLGGGLALSLRAHAPLRRTAGAEGAAGLDWRPVAAVPLSFLVERRQALGHDGRSAFSITAYGGASRTLAGSLQLDAYVQAGLVGLRSRDAFVDGAARVAAPVGPIEIGAGAWGAAQPGAARLDAGPILSYRLPVAGAHLRLQADWRLRVAGDAAPGSGPALTLAADF